MKKKKTNNEKNVPDEGEETDYNDEKKCPR